VQSVRDFLAEIDRRWPGPTGERIGLRIIGSVALLLQTDYERGTKDSDVLHTADLTENTKGCLIELAGEGTEIHRRHRLYIDIVANGIPFLPHVPLYHAVDTLNASLLHFEIHALDVVDVIVSKLKPFRSNDREDIREMIRRGLVSHSRLLERFEDAVDDYAHTAGADDIPQFVGNLNRVERDMLGVAESVLDLPDWIAEGT
jgi:hypothetical protein